MSKTIYPSAPRDDCVDEYHGVKLADPFRPLESSGDGQSQWLAAQDALCALQLPAEALAPWQARLQQLEGNTSTQLVRKVGTDWFLLTADADKPARMLCRSRGLVGRKRTILDPNQWPGGGKAQIAEVAVSPDGNYALVSISWNGADRATWRVVDLRSGETLPDYISGDTPMWLPDSSGFLYLYRSKHETTTEQVTKTEWHPAIWKHLLGTTNEEQCVCFVKENTYWAFDQVSDRWLVLRDGSNPKHHTSGVLIKDLATDKNAPLMRVAPADADIWRTLGIIGDEIYFRTTAGAARGRVVAVKVPGPAEPESQPQVREVVSESTLLLQESIVHAERLVLLYLGVEGSTLKVCLPDGSPAFDVDWPVGAALEYLRRDGRSALTASISSGDQPPALTKVDMRTGRLRTVVAPLSLRGPRMKTTIVEAGKVDGIPVYMRILSRRNRRHRAPAPLILHGYGGFRKATSLPFDPLSYAWVESGGIYVEAFLPGDAILGEEQHLSGIKLKKQNVVNAFMMCADYLVSHGYTTHSQLGVCGGSNGGTLVGAVITQRPDICGAAVIHCGLLDVVRSRELGDAYDTYSNNYGSRDNAEEFQAMLGYSPQQNVRPGTVYPATLVVVGANDDRVFPAHSYKFVAALQEAQAGDGLILLSKLTAAGHGLGMTQHQQALMRGQTLEFFSRHLGLKLQRLAA